MKVKYKHQIQAYSGKMDGLVYFYHPGLERGIAREYVVPRSTEGNRRMKAVTQNLQALKPDQGYRDDLRLYIKLLNSHPDTEHSFQGHYWNLFVKIMWRMASGEWTVESGGRVSIDLETITREFIYAHDLPCISVKKAVESGLLVAVSGYELLGREI